MATTCYCGCGKKVGFARRAFNGTGALVRVQLDAWEEREGLLRTAGLWRPELDELVGVGKEMDADLLNIAHGGQVRLTYPQKEITKWLLKSRALLVELDSADETVAWEEGGPEPPGSEGGSSADPATSADRRAELDEIRASYEEDESEGIECPDCGASFSDNGAYLAHITEAHG